MIGATTVRRVPALLAFFFTLVGSQTLVCGGSVYAADTGVTFGDSPSFKSAENFDYAASPDKKAFTITFNGFEATVAADKLPAAATGRMRGEKSNTPVTTRAVSIVIPLAGSKRIRTSLFASGFALTGKAASATLVFNVNGHNIVRNFPAGENREFIQRLDYRSTSATELRLTLFLIAEGDSTSGDASAFVNVSTIDTDVALKSKKAAGKK